MRQAAAFADILDEKLGAAARVGAFSTVPPAQPRILTYSFIGLTPAAAVPVSAVHAGATPLPPAAPFVPLRDAAASAPSASAAAPHGRTTGPRRAAPSAVPAAAPAAQPAAEPVRPRRTLTAAQRRALADLAALGAAIDPDFTLDELRAAYRRLAMHYHPDRHQRRSAADQAQLALLFGRVHAAYTQLLESGH